MAKSYTGRVSTGGGAYIPLSDIPNAPPLPGAPQLPQYENLNYGKFTYHEAGVGEPINMAGRAAALQQSELPKGFEQGLARAAAAAGTGQEAMGKAISKGAYMLENSLGAAAKVIGDYQDKVAKSADVASYWSAKKILSDSNSAFEAEAALLPATERAKLYGKYSQQNAQALAGLGMTMEGRDRIFAENAQNDIMMRGNLAHANTEELRKNSFQTMENAETNAIAKKEFSVAREAIHDQFRTGNINEATRDEKLRKTLEYEDMALLEDHRARDPKFVAEHLDVTVMRGKDSDLYPHLNKNRELAVKEYQLAQAEWNRRRGLGKTEILNDILDGGTPVNAADIERRGREAGLDGDDIAAMKKAAGELRPFDNETTANATKAVADYRNVARADDTMAKFNAVYNQVITTTSPEIQKLLTTELEGIWKNRNDPGKPQDKEIGEAYELIDKYYKSGMLVGKDEKGKDVLLPSGMGTEEGEKALIVDKKAFQAAQAKRADLYFEVQAFAKDNPGFKAGELIKTINAKMVPDAQQKADDAPTAGMPATPRATFYRATPAPGPATEWRYGTGTQQTEIKSTLAPPTQGPVSQEEIDARMKEIERRKAEGASKPTSSITPASNVLGGRLAGTENKFQAAGEKYGVDPALLMAIAMHETGNGTSKAVADRNNPGGLMDPETNWSEIKRFASLDEGIDSMARNLKEKYIDQGLTSIEAIQQKYAPVGAANDPQGKNKDWVAGVSKFYEKTRGGAEIDEKSAAQIATLKPEARGVMSSFMARAKAWAKSNGLDVFINEGYRTPERQAELYAQGRTKSGPIVTNAKPGQSRHQSARAIDVVITKNGKAVDKKEIWRQLGRIGKEMGLEWGGDFKSIYDPEHFQYVG